MALDPYEELRVPRDGTSADIKKAYRRRIREVHPDRNPDDPHATAKAQQVQDAYELLSDPARRDAYDRDGSVGKPVDMTAAARALLTGMLLEMLKMGGSTKLVGALRIAVKEQEADARRQMESVAAANLRLRAVKGRMRCTGPEDFLAMAIDHAIEKNSDGIEQLRQRADVAARARELLKAYADIADDDLSMLIQDTGTASSWIEL